MSEELMKKINGILGKEEVIKEGEFDVDNPGADALGGDDLGGGDDFGGDDLDDSGEESLSSWVSTVEGDIDPGTIDEIKSFIEFKIQQGGGEEELGDDSDLDDLGDGGDIDIEVEEEYDVEEDKE